MAFATDEIQKILYHLGYPAKTSDPNSLEYRNIIMSRFENVPADSEEIILGLIVQIDDLKAKLTKAHCMMGTKQVGDVTLNPDMVAKNLKGELRRLYRELSQVINIKYIGGMGSVNKRVVW